MGAGVPRPRFDPIQVLVVMPVRIYREALAEWLNNCSAVELLGAIAAVDGIMSNAFPVRPEVVLVDYRDPECFRIASTSLRIFPGTKLVAIGGDQGDEEMDACAEAGICGHVAAGASVEELIATIEDIVRGDIPCSPGIAVALVRRVTAINSREPLSSIELTPRELEIVGCFRDALSNKEIARRLNIEVNTVKNHVQNVLRKLAVHRRADAASATFGRS